METSGFFKDWWDLVLVALLGAGMLFSNLAAPLLEPDESRYAEIPRLMLLSGDWITPKLQGKPYNDKPPLVYWLIAANYHVFGVCIESARFIPALAGWLTLLVVYAWTRRHFNRSIALFACLSLLTMLGYAAMMRMLLLDGVFTFLVVSSLLAGHHAISQRRHPGWWLISALFCGLAVLAKGPVAIVLIAPSLFALRWLDRSLTPVRFFDCAWYGFVVLAIALPWYGTMLLTNESFGSEHFLRHHLRRFLDPAHHERPFWYYVPAVFVELMPWSFLGLAVWPRWRTWSGSERFLLFFSLFCFVFFSIARAKLPTYLLPILPIFAILVGKQLQLILPLGGSADASSSRSESRYSYQLILFGIGLTLMAIALAFRNWALHFTVEEGTPGIDYWALSFAIIVSLLLIAKTISSLVNLPSSSLVSWPTNPRSTWLAAMAMAVLVLFRIAHHAIPEYAEGASVVPHCLKLVSLAEKEGIPYAAYRNSWDAVSFQLNREELHVFSSREQSQLNEWLFAHSRCMIWMRDYDKRTTEFIKNLPPGIELEQLFDFSKLQAFILKKTASNSAEMISQQR